MRVPANPARRQVDPFYIAARRRKRVAGNSDGRLNRCPERHAIYVVAPNKQHRNAAQTLYRFGGRMGRSAWLDDNKGPHEIRIAQSRAESEAATLAVSQKQARPDPLQCRVVGCLNQRLIAIPSGPSASRNCRAPRAET